MDRNEIAAYLEKQPFWPHLTGAQQNLILDQARQAEYRSGDAVLSERDDCLGALFILKGILRVYLLAEDGRQITIYRLHGGEACVLAASCALPAITFDVQIDAEEDCSLLILPTPAFSRLMEENIWLEAFAYRLTAEHFSSIMGAVERIFFMTLEQRVAAFLIDESAELGSDSIPFTQEKLAMAIGSAREAVSRILNQFSREGCVSLSRGCIRILDKNALYSKLSLNCDKRRQNRGASSGSGQPGRVNAPERRLKICPCFLIRSQSAKAIELSRQDFLALYADHSIHFFAVLENDQRGNAHHAIAGSQFLLLIHVQFSRIIAFFRQLLDGRPLHSAGHTPGRPKIHQNRPLRLQYFRFKILRRKFLRHMKISFRFCCFRVRWC